jgi:hypothetical protein
VSRSYNNKQYGIATPKSVAAHTPQEAFNVAKTFGVYGLFFNHDARLISLPFSQGTNKLVIKAQVLAGGRGKGRFDNGFQGGVHLIDRYGNQSKQLSRSSHVFQRRTGSGLRYEDDWVQAYHKTDRCSRKNLQRCTTPFFGAEHFSLSRID